MNTTIQDSSKRERCAWIYMEQINYLEYRLTYTYINGR